MGYSSLNKDYVEKFTSTLQKINRLPTAYLATELIETFQKGKSGEPDLYDDFYSEIGKERLKHRYFDKKNNRQSLTPTLSGFINDATFIIEN